MPLTRTTRVTRADSPAPVRPRDGARTTPSSGSKLQRTAWALQAFWHPDTPTHSKAHWAELYGVTKQLVYWYEKQTTVGALEPRFRSGAEPPPPPAAPGSV